MKYEVEFDNNKADEMFIRLYHAFEQSESCFTDGDLMRNIVNTVTFENLMRQLQLFNTDTDFGSYEDNGFLRIGYARIGSCEFVKNGAVNYSRLKEALWEIAHPKGVENHECA